MSEDRVFLSCDNLWKVYGSRPEEFLAKHDYQPSDEQLAEGSQLAAVNNINLEVLQGETLVVMGLSGSGKSTLIRCLARLTEPTSGGINFDGSDLLAMNKKELISLRRQRMGMVFQHFALLPHKAVLENVMFPLEVQGVDKAERIKLARELLEVVGLQGRDYHFPRQLSGGEQQRVGIARSLAVKPDIWFLDEPFSALDPLIREEMQDEFIRLRETLGKTIMFITHDFDEALRLADRMAIMNHGRIEQLDTPDQIVLNPATDYIGRFTRKVDKTRILTIGALATPLSESDAKEEVMGDEEPLRKSDKLSTVASRIFNTDRETLPVIDESGQLFGNLNCHSALKILLE